MTAMNLVAAVVEQSWHRVPGGTALATLRSLDAVDQHPDWRVVGISARHRHGPEPQFQPSFEVAEMPLPRPLLYEAWHRIGWPSVESVVGSCDVIHATGGAIPPRRTTPIVVTVHDLAFLDNPHHFTRRGRSFMGHAAAVAQRRATLVVVPSEVTAQACIEYGFAPERIRVVSWGVSPRALAEADPRGSALRRALDLPDDYLLWVGTAEPRKNLARMIEAVERSESDISLVIAGPDGWGVDLDALISQTRVPVRRVGMVTDDQLSALYGGATAVLYPSLLEGFGMPVLEAMAHGRPVITSLGTATEEAAAGAGLLVDPRSVDAIAAAIDRVVGDSDLADELGAAGLRVASAATWAVTGQRLVDVYDEAKSMGPR